MTPLQSRLARTALNWGIRDMPNVAGVASSTVTRFEKGQNISLETYKVLKAAYEDHHIKFLNDGDEANGIGISIEGHTSD